MVICLEVRRFRCLSRDCPEQTFAEQVSGLTSRHARRTPAVTAMLQAVALALGGRAGARAVGPVSGAGEPDDTAPAGPGHARPGGQHAAYLYERWNSGCMNAAQLWVELRERGYPGGPGHVRRYLARFRGNAAAPQPQPPPLRPRHEKCARARIQPTLTNGA